MQKRNKSKRSVMNSFRFYGTLLKKKHEALSGKLAWLIKAHFDVITQRNVISTDFD